jgi:hypothetical protein
MRSILILVVTFAIACGHEKGDPAKLEALMAELRDAVHAKDRDKVRAITRSLVPTKQTLQLVLRSSVDDKVRDRLLEDYERMWDRPEDVFEIDRDRKEVKVESYVEEQHRLLEPGLTLYTVRFTHPGKSSGMKYHRFVWDGRNWKMLGKLRH